MRAMAGGKHSGRVRWVRSMGATGRHALASPCPTATASCAISPTAGWPASGRPTTSSSDRSVAVKVLASHLSEDDAHAPLRARGARRRRAVVAPARRDDLRRRRARRPRVHGHGADARRHRRRRLQRRPSGSPTSARCAGCARPPRRSTPPTTPASCTATSSPANLLLDDRDRLAIADFGIARLALEDQLTADRPGARHRRLHLARAGGRRAGRPPRRTATRWRSWPSSC